MLKIFENIKSIITPRQYDSLESQLVNEYNATRPEHQRTHLCHAPFKSLRFANGGKSLVCCFNRKYHLGSYPENTIHEMWFGERANKLRDYVLHNDLQLGCYYCKNQIENKEFAFVKTKMYDHLPPSSKGYPNLMEFELSNLCNLECVMCRGVNSSLIRKNREHLPPIHNPYDQAFVRQLDEFIPHLRQGSFIGGEPFLINMYFDIWNNFFEINPEIEINVTTNATILNSKVKEVIGKGKFSFSVSLESLEKETFEAIRVNANLDRVLKNLEFFHDYTRANGRYFCVWICPLRHNWHEIPDIVNHFSKKEIEVFLHTVWIPPSATLWNLDSETLKEIQQSYAGAILLRESEVQERNFQQFENYKNQLTHWLKGAEERESNPVFSSESSGIAELKNLLTLRISTHYKNKGVSPKDDLVNSHMEKIDFWIKTLKSESKAQNALRTLMSYPLGFIIEELELSETKEQMVESFMVILQ